MKTLSTLAAVAALIAGVSVASAQMSPTAPSAGDNSATSGTSQQVTGTGKYCIESSPGGALNCRYASLDACQKVAQSSNAQCAPNPKSSTTGSKQ
jgi:hypothetical protein